MAQSVSEVVIEHVRSAGILRPRDLESEGIRGSHLARLARLGRLIRVGRGLYSLPNGQASAQHTLAAVAARVPNGLTCLESALRFHDLTTAAPRRVWVAIEPKAWKPRVGDLPVQIVRFSGEALTAGVERHEVDGVSVPVYSPAKTVADCFKYRNKLGLDLAIEALLRVLGAATLHGRRNLAFARIDRVANVMRPCMESLR